MKNLNISYAGLLLPILVILSVGTFSCAPAVARSSGQTTERCLAGNCVNGTGTFITKKGDIYEGDFVAGDFQGKGKYTYSSGSIYEGDFVGGDFHGKGKYTYSNGNVYEGDYVHDERHGKGKYTYSDGDVYEGDYAHDERTGKGKFTYSDGDVHIIALVKIAVRKCVPAFPMTLTFYIISLVNVTI